MAGGSMKRRLIDDESSSFVKSGFTWGNPRQYRKPVVKMTPNFNSSFESTRNKDAASVNDTETEGEKHFKRLLDKQLKKDITLRELSSETRNFVKSSSYKPFTEEIIGKIDLNDFKTLNEEKCQIEHLKQCGLDESEIELWISQNNFTKSSGGCKISGVEPSAMQSRLKIIENKIKTKQNDLEEEVQSRGVRFLNRHEMEIEATVKCTDERVQLLQKLVQRDRSTTKNVHPDDPINSIKTLEEEMFGHLKVKKRKRNKKVKQNEGIVEPSPEDGEIQIATCSCRPIYDDDIMTNRLTIDQIKQIPRFSDYDCGKPNNVLYLKNLNRRVDKLDLCALFDRFKDDDNCTPDIRLLTGKMHGQAFITFSNNSLAQRALELLNGYMLINKPMIIQYKRSVLEK